MLRFLIWMLLTITSGCLPHADPIPEPPKQVGTLNCRILAHSGFNLLIHSTRDVLCTFTPTRGEAVEYYRGETGIGFGLDVNLNRRSRIAYAVLATDFRPGSHALAGRYEGAGGGITLGVTAGESAPIRKADGSITLQPIQMRGGGAGAAAGLTYLYLEPDPEASDSSK
ncbi:MAG: DUF992 domain-containing protein [Bacteroidetes bacterium]|nr:MAG: DUF992 domain-containing protein [Bacteroidota bacterium]